MVKKYVLTDNTLLRFGLGLDARFEGFETTNSISKERTEL